MYCLQKTYFEIRISKVKERKESLTTLSFGLVTGWMVVPFTEMEMEQVCTGQV